MPSDERKRNTDNRQNYLNTAPDTLRPSRNDDLRDNAAWKANTLDDDDSWLDNRQMNFND